MQPTTSAEYLDAVRTPSDVLSVTDDGSLAVDGILVADLLSQFGSPLYVACKSTLRSNFRRIRKAFAEGWPAPVNVLYAIKANNNPAIRAILHQEGAGGDCFGVGELHITFVGGADPALIVVNGSSKTYGELEAAVARGVSINVDDEAELDDLADIARRTGKAVRVNLRLKIVPTSFADHGSDYFGVQRDVATHLRAWKWGFSPEAARRLIERIGGTPGLRLTGYSAHSGRVTTNPTAVGDYTEELGRVVAQLAQATGFKPAVLDIGGGWPRQRDPQIAQPRAQSLADRGVCAGGDTPAAFSTAGGWHPRAATLAGAGAVHRRQRVAARRKGGAHQAGFGPRLGQRRLQHQ